LNDFFKKTSLNEPLYEKQIFVLKITTQILD